VARPGREAALFFSTVTLRFDPDRGLFDDAPLDEFARSKEVLAVRDHFFTHGGLPHLLLCVSWRMPPSGSARRAKPDEDWRSVLATPEQQDRNLGFRPAECAPRPPASRPIAGSPEPAPAAELRRPPRSTDAGPAPGAYSPASGPRGRIDVRAAPVGSPAGEGRHRAPPLDRLFRLALCCFA